MPDAAIRPISRRGLIEGLHSLGFDPPDPGGRHQIMRKGDLTVSIPNPRRGDISVNLLARILREVGISREECESV
ncbi:MAG TPA: type II toxin-antitoxin system HicA family toxin [Chloroflexota bacterium]|nr:type II toxin-antitoxin system HicA family toxin [Chloroflexota bacterium]